MFGTIGTTGSYTPPRSAAKFKGGGVGPSPTYSYSAAIVEVEIDPSTGWIHVPNPGGLLSKRSTGGVEVVIWYQ